MSYADFLRRAAELKVDGVSLETCFFESLDESYLKGLKEIIDAAAWSLSSRGGTPRASRGARTPRPWRTCRSIYRVCHILGAKVMRVVGSSLDYRNDPHEPQIQALTAIFKEAAQVAEGEGVKLAMENHFDFTMDEFIGSRRPRWTRPTSASASTRATALRIGDDPVESARLLGKHIFATHTKDVKPVYGVSPKDWISSPASRWGKASSTCLASWMPCWRPATRAVRHRAGLRASRGQGRRHRREDRASST